MDESDERPDGRLSLVNRGFVFRVNGLTGDMIGCEEALSAKDTPWPCMDKAAEKSFLLNLMCFCSAACYVLDYFAGMPVRLAANKNFHLPVLHVPSSIDARVSLGLCAMYLLSSVIYYTWDI